mmetsp:Transcript_22416/g.48971  ORF Transcript_22416/g.48971 Transcript_22416/m.48971 type:complete len:489 (+) Transcript_22416:352-1818(+)
MAQRHNHAEFGCSSASTLKLLVCAVIVVHIIPSLGGKTTLAALAAGSGRIQQLEQQKHTSIVHKAEPTPLGGSLKPLRLLLRSKLEVSGTTPGAGDSASLQTAGPQQQQQNSPVAERQTPSSATTGCTLHNNIVASRRQLLECNFTAVMVLPNANFSSTYVQPKQPTWPWQKLTRFSGSAIQLNQLPYPVVACVPRPGMPRRVQLLEKAQSTTGSTHEAQGSTGASSTGPLLEDFMSTSLDDPPCIRPAAGREDVAYVSFILQNYDNLPPHVFFLHGHETSWHQDSSITEMLQELPLPCPLPPDLYLSFGNSISRDWRRMTCLFGACKSRRLQAVMERAWSQFFSPVLGALPPDLSHFCCAQMLVSRDRILRRPPAVYAAALSWSLTACTSCDLMGDRRSLSEGQHWGFTGRRMAQQSCVLPSKDGCFIGGAIMEALWPYIFGESVPLSWGDAEEARKYPHEKQLSSAILQAYRQQRTASTASTNSTS